MTLYLPFCRSFLLCTVLQILLFPCFGQKVTIEGKVKDGKTKEELSGASAFIKENHLITITGNDGEFKFEGIQPGIYTLIVKYLGYDSVVKTINCDNLKKSHKGEQPEINVNILMSASSHDLREVEVKEKINKESEGGSRNQERNANNTVNIISAQAIELSPDITAANVLQRISGVSLERTNQGDGQYAILRGMDPRYNNTLINGDKIPSPDAFNRFLPLDIIPSELLEQIEVHKTLTPDMEGDAIGGTVNIVMKDAPDKLLVTADVFTGYSQAMINNGFNHYNRGGIIHQDPAELHGLSYTAQPNDFTRNNLKFNNNKFTPDAAIGLTVGNRFFKNKLGVIVSGTYQNRFSGADNTFYFIAADQHSVPYAYDVTSRRYSTQQERIGANVKLDYRINGNHQITLTNVYLNMQNIETRIGTDTSLTTFRTGPGTGQVFVKQRFFWTQQSIETFTLQGKHTFPIIGKNNSRHLLTLKWKGLFSIAANKTPDKAELETDFLIDGSYKKSNEYFDAISRIWQHNSDRDYSGIVDLEYKVPLRKYDLVLKTGGLIRIKSRDNYQNEYSLRPTLVNGQKEQYNGNIDSLQWVVYNPGGTPTYGTNNYTASETVGAAYLEFITNIKFVQILGGVRMESTEQSFHTSTLYSATGVSNDISYIDVMPNLQFKFSLPIKNHKMEHNLRLAGYSAISRPSYFDLVPYTIQGENYLEQGNTNLQHTKAWNADLRYEFYMNGRDQLLAGVFYKNISNPIEQAFDLSNIYNPVFTYINSGNATNYGFEFVLIKYYKDFGINLNYTFTQSSITTLKILNDSTSTRQVPETRPLQGQSKHIFNAALMYQNKKLGIDIQIAYQLTGKRIADLSPFYGIDYYQKNLSLLDFSIDKTFKKRYTIYAKVNNLLNSPTIVQINNGLLAEKTISGLNFLIGFRFKL